jgi:hypothetical protein
MNDLLVVLRDGFRVTIPGDVGIYLLFSTIALWISVVMQAWRASLLVHVADCEDDANSCSRKNPDLWVTRRNRFSDKQHAFSFRSRKYSAELEQFELSFLDRWTLRFGRAVRGIAFWQIVGINLNWASALYPIESQVLLFIGMLIGTVIAAGAEVGLLISCMRSCTSHTKNLRSLVELWETEDELVNEQVVTRPPAPARERYVTPVAE